MSFSLYDRGTIIRREASLDSLANKPALHRSQRANLSANSADKESTKLPAGTGRLPPGVSQYAELVHEEEVEKKPVSRALDIMSEQVTTLGINDTIDAAAGIFRKHRFRHIPIVSDDKIFGIVSDRDLFQHPELPGDTIITDLMQTPVLTARPEASIHDIARALYMERIGCLPIVNDIDQLIGIITRSDILRSLIYAGPVELWG